MILFPLLPAYTNTFEFSRCRPFLPPWFSKFTLVINMLVLNTTIATGFTVTVVTALPRII